MNINVSVCNYKYKLNISINTHTYIYTHIHMLYGLRLENGDGGGRKMGTVEVGTWGQRGLENGDGRGWKMGMAEIPFPVPHSQRPPSLTQISKQGAQLLSSVSTFTTFRSLTFRTQVPCARWVTRKSLVVENMLACCGNNAVSLS